jgi:hypothetical protein
VRREGVCVSAGGSPAWEGSHAQKQSKRRRRQRIRRSLRWKGSLGDSAKMQAVTQVNARRGLETIGVEADPSDIRGRPARQGKSATRAPRRSTGVETMACIEGMHMKHGKPRTAAAATATESPRGPGPAVSVAERLVVAMKPGNAGGAKGPHFGRVGGRDKGIAIGFGLATQ